MHWVTTRRRLPLILHLHQLTWSSASSMPKPTSLKNRRKTSKNTSTWAAATLPPNAGMPICWYRPKITRVQSDRSNRFWPWTQPPIMLSLIHIWDKYIYYQKAGKNIIKKNYWNVESTIKKKIRNSPKSWKNADAKPRIGSFKQATKSNELNDIYQVMKKKFNTLKKKLLLQPLIKQETLKITNFEGCI